MNLPQPLAIALAVVAGVLEIIQQVSITMSSQAHATISMALIALVGVGIVPLSGAAIKRLIPLHYAALISAALGIGQVIQQNALSVSKPVHAAIAFVLVVAAGIGLVPSAPPTAAARREKRAQHKPAR